MQLNIPQPKVAAGLLDHRLGDLVLALDDQVGGAREHRATRAGAGRRPLGEGAVRGIDRGARVLAAGRRRAGRGLAGEGVARLEGGARLRGAPLAVDQELLLRESCGCHLLSLGWLPAPGCDLRTATLLTTEVCISSAVRTRATERDRLRR